MTSQIPPTIGKRVAELRQQRGWTQQALATRLAVSRVTVSHIEMDLTTPSERTVTLLASLFRRAPHDLVAGTNYPQAKAERLPHAVAWYTPFELDMQLLQNDLAWLEKVDGNHLRDAVCAKWMPRLREWEQRILDNADQQKLSAARDKVNKLGARGSAVRQSPIPAPSPTPNTTPMEEL